MRFITRGHEATLFVVPTPVAEICFFGKGDATRLDGLIVVGNNETDRFLGINILSGCMQPFMRAF